jgi:anti-sigma-K factor RskA
MNTIETINSGDLELYVYGVLNESEMNQIAELSKSDSSIKNEILSIENSILQLSSSFSPNISSEIYEKIKIKLGLKTNDVVTMKPKSNHSQYLGWAASIALLVGIGYLYNKQITIENEIVTIEKEKVKLNEAVATSEGKIKETKAALDIIRDTKNTVVSLGGQAVSPTSYAKVYWNKETQVVYVDAAGLPEPPEGMVYQVWSLKLSPTLTPTSIGLLEDFKSDNNKLFAVSNTGDAEAFGITLEPVGGSKTPTMEQLYALGKV